MVTDKRTFRREVLPALRSAGMEGLTLARSALAIQARLARVTRGGVAA